MSEHLREYKDNEQAQKLLRQQFGRCNKEIGRKAKETQLHVTKETKKITNQNAHLDKKRQKEHKILMSSLKAHVAEMAELKADQAKILETQELILTAVKEEKEKRENADIEACKRALTYESNPVSFVLTGSTCSESESASLSTLASSKKGSHAESVRNRKTFRQLSDKILDDNVRLEYECKYKEDKLKAFELPSKDSSRVIPRPQGMTTRAQKAREAHLENQVIGRRKEQQKKADNPLKG